MRCSSARNPACAALVVHLGDGYPRCTNGHTQRHAAGGGRALLPYLAALNRPSPRVTHPIERIAAERGTTPREMLLGLARKHQSMRSAAEELGLSAPTSISAYIHNRGIGWGEILYAAREEKTQ